MIVTPSSDRKLLAIFLVVLIDVLGLTIILPLLPFYSEKFGASPFVVGLLVAVYAACQLISGPILGAWSDKIGRKPVLVVSQIGTLIGFVILAEAPSLAWIFVSRIIDGITAGNLSTAQAYITDHTAPENRAKALGKLSIAFGVGYFVGPALTAVLSRYGDRTPIYAAVALSFLSIITSLVLLPREESRKPQAPTEPTSSIWSSGVKYFRDPMMRHSLIELSIFYFAFAAYISGLPLFAERRFTFNGQPFTSQEMGYMISYLGFLGIVIQGFMLGHLVARFGERKLTMQGFAVSFIGYAMLVFTREPMMIAISGLLTSFGVGVLRPSLLSMLTKNSPVDERGGVIGISNSLSALSQIIAPMVATALIGSQYIQFWGLLPALLSAYGVYFNRKEFARP
jgi:MFS family permease